MKGTPEQNIEEILGMIESLSSEIKNNEDQSRVNLVALKQMAAGMAEHDKKIKTLDKLVNMMVDCGTSKDLEEQLGSLKQNVGAIRSYVRGLIDAIDENESYATRERIVEKLSIVENDLIKVIES